jgi:hypothetical protein
MHHGGVRRAASLLMVATVVVGLAAADFPASGIGNPSLSQSLWLFEKTLRDERHPGDPSYNLRPVPPQYGTQFVPGRDPGTQGLALDGSSYLVDNRPNDDPTPFGAYPGDFTVRVTFKYTGAVPPPRPVVNVISSRPTCFAPGGFTPHWNIYLDSGGRARMQYTSSSALGREAIHAAGPSLFDGQFHEVTLQRSGSTMQLVVDGVEVASKPVDPGTVGTQGEVWVGVVGLSRHHRRRVREPLRRRDRRRLPTGWPPRHPPTRHRRRPAMPSVPMRTRPSPSLPPGCWATTPIPTRMP